MKAKVMVILLLTLLSACMRVRPKDDEDKSEHGMPTGAPEINYEIQAGAEPNQYKVLFVFDRPVGEVSLIKITGNKKTDHEIKVQSQQWYDVEATPGLSTTYRFGEKAQGQFRMWHEIQVNVPQDLIVKGPVSIDDKIIVTNIEKEKNRWTLKNYRRLYISATGRLTLQGNSVRMNFAEIYSDGGTIENFPKDAKAPVGENGRSGGDIEIFADQARGVLHVDLRGENGGDGNPGKAPDAAIKGVAGKNGAPGVAVKDYSGLYSCRPEPTAGTPGEQGLPGYPGNEGGAGGNSGSLNIVIKKAVGFSLVATKIPGDGGKGGLGGEGGEGGDGGVGGSAPLLPGLGGPCNHYPTVNGPRGRRGVTGANGMAGQTMRICETQESQPKNCY